MAMRGAAEDQDKGQRGRCVCRHGCDSQAADQTERRQTPLLCEVTVLQAEHGWSCVVTSVRCSTDTVKPNQLGETIMKKDYDTPPLNAEINSLL